MGTLLALSAAAADATAAEVAADAALAAAQQVEALMSFHDPGSELSRLNREACRAPQRVHPWTGAVLRRACRIAAASGGLFDPTVAPTLVATGCLPDPGGPPPATGLWRHIRFPAPDTVWFERPLWLDLGGIAKGFAVDAAIRALRRHGCTAGAVNAGGDLRRFGPVPHTIHLRRDDGLHPVAALRCGAVATSGLPPGSDAAALGVILDPRTGGPWRAGSVMVAAATCVVADALTKVAALAGPACAPLLARFGAQARWESAGRFVAG